MGGREGGREKRLKKTRESCKVHMGSEASKLQLTPSVSETGVPRAQDRPSVCSVTHYG